MSAIDKTFEQLRGQNRKAFVPFVTAGDPDLEFTGDAIQTLEQNGASICEVGIPYSDPIADGPVIQASYTRALQRGVKLEQIFATLGQTAAKVNVPLVTMVSYAIVLRKGLQDYVQRAQQAGVSGLIVPDLLVDEAPALAKVCGEFDMSLIQLVTPTTPDDRALRIAETTTGFLYYVSVAGITGERTRLPDNLVDRVAWLREHSHVPVCVGFGISRAEQAQLLAPVADGVIVGSALVRRMQQVSEGVDRQQVLGEMGDLSRELANALMG